jgi:hypothetical protein
LPPVDRATLRLSVSASLLTDLASQAKACGLPVENYAQQIIEVFAAERRFRPLAAPDLPGTSAEPQESEEQEPQEEDEQRREVRDGFVNEVSKDGP